MTCTVRGIQLSARLALALEVGSIAVVVGVLVWLLVPAEGSAGSAAALVDARPGWGGIALAVMLGVTAFMGFESAGVLGEEAQRPLIAVPRAVVWTPAVAGVLFLFAAVAQTVLLRQAPLDVLMSPVPVARLSESVG